MGCCGSSAAKKPDQTFSEITPSESAVTNGKINGRPLEPVVKGDGTKKSLVPAFHVDKHGNKINDKTGERVWSEAYYKGRLDADKYAKLRADCFERSKKAFEDGKKREAKDLSEEGKRYGKLMEDMNTKAVNEILLPQKLDSIETIRIDLHGLLVNEAVDATKAFANKCKGRHSMIQVITGAGIHSHPKKGPAIKPAIIELCKAEKWRLEPEPENEGSFKLYL